MDEKIEALQVAAHQAAKDNDYDKALQILDSLLENREINRWDITFYRTYYKYGRKSMEKTSFSHIPQLNKAVVDAFALALSQNLDILETLVCFQDIYDQIWDLSSRLQQSTHREYIGLIKGKSVTEEFYQKQTAQYIDQLKKILELNDHFINALGNLSQFTTINHDHIWDFFQSNDGLYCFLLTYDKDPSYQEKREENIKIIHLKRPDYKAESLPKEVEPAELRSAKKDPPKKKGFFGRFFN